MRLPWLGALVVFLGLGVVLGTCLASERLQARALALDAAPLPIIEPFVPAGDF